MNRWEVCGILLLNLYSILLLFKLILFFCFILSFCLIFFLFFCFLSLFYSFVLFYHFAFLYYIILLSLYSILLLSLYSILLLSLYSIIKLNLNSVSLFYPLLYLFLSFNYPFILTFCLLFLFYPFTISLFYHFAIYLFYPFSISPFYHFAFYLLYPFLFFFNLSLWLFLFILFHFVRVFSLSFILSPSLFLRRKQKCREFNKLSGASSHFSLIPLISKYEYNYPFKSRFKWTRTWRYPKQELSFELESFLPHQPTYALVFVYNAHLLPISYKKFQSRVITLLWN